MVHKNQLVQLKEKINKHFDAGELRELVFDLGLDFDNIPGNIKKARIIALVDHLNNADRIPELISSCQKHRPNVTWTYQAKLFIAYKRATQQDADLAIYLQDALKRSGHTVFIDQSMRSGEEWLDRIDLRWCALKFTGQMSIKKHRENRNYCLCASHLRVCCLMRLLHF